MAENVTKSDVLDAFNFFKSEVTDVIYASTDTATTTSNGLMSAADKVKLNGVATDTYATKTELNGKLDSDATLGFATKSDLTGYVEKVSGKDLSTNDFTTAEKNKLDSLDTDAFVAKIAGKDLSTNDFSDAYKSKLDGVDTDSYVMKVSGKGLSTNDFTTAEKNKLTNIADSAQVNAIESVKVNNVALPISNKTVNIDLANASVKSAASLNSAKSLKVSLASSNAQSFDGSDNATVIGVGGILPVANGGTGNANGTVSGAAKLNTAQNFITNLASTVAGSFNGTASVSAGVTGTLPVANGGTGQTDLNNVTVGGANRDGAGNVITDTYVTKTEFTRGTAKVWRFGYRIKQSEADPYERVEYIYDAAGMTPAHMVYDTDTDTAGTSSDKGYFDYGSWRDVWFVRDNKPLMLKYDGSVDYYLDPNDYSKKEDGTESDVANTDYDGNAMAQFPLVWIKRYTEGDYLYEIVSNVQYDEDYKPYAHTDANGIVKDYFYLGIYPETGSASKIRSLSGQTRVQLNISQMVSGASANGSNWYIVSWAQLQLLRTLSVLMSKSTNHFESFGCHYNAAPESMANLVPLGDGNSRGQFFGFPDFSSKAAKKFFHIEFIVNSIAVVGLVINGRNVYAKMSPQGGYLLQSTTGYTFLRTLPLVDDVFFKTGYVNEYGFLPTDTGGSSSTYYCIRYLTYNNGWKVPCLGNNLFNVIFHQELSKARPILGSFLAYV